MNYSLTNTLGKRIGGLDPDAAAWIAELVTRGVNLTHSQRNAIDAFIVEEKAQSRWSIHRRIYIPIWGIEAANAVDMISRTSGAFTASGVTHGAGFVQGNGTSGFFDTITPWQSLASLTNATIGTLNITGHSSPNMTSIGVGATGANAISVGSQNSGVTPVSNWAGAGITRGAIGTSGVQMVSRLSGVTRMIRRSSSGITEDTSTASITGSVMNEPITVMGRRFASGANITQFSNAQIGGVIISEGMGSSALSGFSLNLQTLWAALTGLTPP
jgi:hypothetical protein